MRIVNPTPAELVNALNAAVGVANGAAKSKGSKNVITGWTEETAPKLADGIAKQAAGFVEFTADGKPGELAAAVSVAWYTRLNGVKVFQIRYTATKVNKAGGVDSPALVPAEYREHLFGAAGYPVLASERLACLFSAVLKCAAKPGAPAEMAEVLEQPGDLNVWGKLADVFDANGKAEAADDLRRAIGAA